MYTYIWIEGEANLRAFCKKRFNDSPRFVETIGHCGPATIYEIYKWRQDKHDYTDMFLLFMEYHKGKVSWIELKDNIYFWKYEQIRADRNSILR